jgi:hypothetical protein
MLTDLYKRLCGFDSVREVSCYYDYGLCVEGCDYKDAWLQTTGTSIITEAATSSLTTDAYAYRRTFDGA